MSPPVMVYHYDDSPVPQGLTNVLSGLVYKKGWKFEIRVRALVVFVETEDSLNPGRRVTIAHRHPIPPIDSPHFDWMRWVLDAIIKVETHEACEFFTVRGQKPYFPDHQDPYRVQKAS